MPLRNFNIICGYLKFIFIGGFLGLISWITQLSLKYIFSFFVSSTFYQNFFSILRWSANDLSDKSGVGISTVKRLEVMDGVPAINISTMVAIQSALENAGVEFIGSPDDRPGVRLK